MALNLVPNSNENLAQTQQPILNNFSTIDTVFSVDHVPYATSGAGKHNKITFPNQLAAPAFLAGEIGLFNQNALPTSRNDIWLQRGAGTAYPMTGFDFDNTGPFSGGNGWTYIPSGFISTWGKATTTAGTITITFGSSPGGGLTGFPGFDGDGGGNFVGYFNLTMMDAASPSTNYPVLAALTLTTMTVNSSDGNDLTFMWNVTGF